MVLKVMVFLNSGFKFSQLEMSKLFLYLKLCITALQHR